MLIIRETDIDSAKIAAEFLRAGKIVAFAADTVYGIAVDASNSRAVDRVYKIKKRHKKKPIAIFLPDVAMAEKIFYFDDLAKRIVQKFFPGGLTLILKKRQNSLINLAKNLNENDDFIGFRIVKKNFVVKLFQEFSGILAVTSANISGDKAATDAEFIAKNFADEIDLLIDGNKSSGGVSTVVKIDGDNLQILREGIVSSELIRK